MYFIWFATWLNIYFALLFFLILQLIICQFFLYKLALPSRYVNFFLNLFHKLFLFYYIFYISLNVSHFLPTFSFLYTVDDSCVTLTHKPKYRFSTSFLSCRRVITNEYIFKNRCDYFYIRMNQKAVICTYASINE